MPWAVFFDQEALELLDAAAEMASAALAARSRRVDEDGVLKRSVDMSRIKLETLRASMHQAPLIEYHELEPAQREAFHQMAVLAFSATDPEKADAAWKTLRTFILRPGKKEPFSGGSKPWGDDDLSAPRVARPAKKAETRKAEMSGRVRERRKPDTPQAGFK